MEFCLHPRIEVSIAELQCRAGSSIQEFYDAPLMTFYGIRSFVCSPVGIKNETITICCSAAGDDEKREQN